MSDVPMDIDELDQEMKMEHHNVPHLNPERVEFNESRGPFESAQEPPEHDHSNLAVFLDGFSPEERAIWALDQVRSQNNQQEVTWPQWNRALPAQNTEILQNENQTSGQNGNLLFNEISHQLYFNSTAGRTQWLSDVNSAAYTADWLRYLAQEQCIQTVAELLCQPAGQLSSASSTWNAAIQPVEGIVPPSRPSTLQSPFWEPAVNDPGFEQDFRQKIEAPGLIPCTEGRPPYVCDKCGISGHVIADCPMKKTEPTTPYRGNKISNARFICRQCKWPYTRQIRPDETSPCPKCGTKNLYHKMYKIEKGE